MNPDDDLLLAYLVLVEGQEDNRVNTPSSCSPVVIVIAVLLFIMLICAFASA
jgi:membrane associated rhomboid family serine protease